MNSSKVSYLLFALSLILISHAPILASCQRLFVIVCREVGSIASGQCLELLRTDPRESPQPQLNMAIEKGIQGQNYFMNLAKANPNSQAIKQCATVFITGTISSFKSAIGELASDPRRASLDAYLAGDGPTNCDRAIAAEGIHNLNIFVINNMMVLLSEIAESATNHLR